jgi:AcrR family transcriptional regulator
VTDPSIPAPSFRAAVRTMLRDRLLDAAAALFAEQGWQKLTMAKVADRAGVSRQTVYNELGGKQQVAEQLVMRELEHFLEVVRTRFAAEDELVPAVRAAVEGALDAAEQDDLLRAALESAHSGDSDLLPFILQSKDLVDRATEFLEELVTGSFPDLPLTASELRIVLESVVRLMISHVTTPSAPAASTAAAVAFLVDAVLAGTAARLP